MRYKNISNLLLVIAGALLTSQTIAAPTDYDGKWSGFISCSAYFGNAALGAFTRNNIYAIENGRIKAKYTTVGGKNTLTSEGNVNNGIAKLTINGVNDTTRWTFNFTGTPSSAEKIVFSGDMLEQGAKRRDCTMEFTTIEPAIASLAFKKTHPASVAKAETPKPTPTVTPVTNSPKIAEAKVVTPAPVVAPTVAVKAPATAPAIQPVIQPTQVTTNTPQTTQTITPTPVGEPKQAPKADETLSAASQEAQPAPPPAPINQSMPTKSFTLNDLINNNYFLIGVAIALLVLVFFIIRAILRFLKRKAIEAANATKRKASEVAEKINTEANALKDSVTNNINDFKDKAKEKANELSDAAKDKANELSNITQDKVAELTAVAKVHAEKLNEDFNKEGGHKDKIKEASAQGISMAKAMAKQLGGDAQETNEVRKDIPGNGGLLSKKQLAINFYKSLTAKQKILILSILLSFILYQFSGGGKPCSEVDKGKAPIEIYNYSCDAEQLKSLARQNIDNGMYCRLQGNIATRKISCKED